MKRTTEKAFTLLELLVTISIVAILAALMFAGTKKASRSAMQAKCLSNVRQQYLAQISYAAENNGQFASRAGCPYPMYVRGPGSPAGESAYDVLKSYLTGDAMTCPILADTLGKTPDYRFFRAAPYNVDGYANWDGAKEAANGYVLSGYAWFANMDNPRTIAYSPLYEAEQHQWPNRLSDCTSKNVLITHEKSAHDFTHDGAGFGAGWNLETKSTGTVVCFGDGHIILRPFSEIEVHAAGVFSY